MAKITEIVLRSCLSPSPIPRCPKALENLSCSAQLECEITVQDRKWGRAKQKKRFTSQYELATPFQCRRLGNRVSLVSEFLDLTAVVLLFWPPVNPPPPLPCSSDPTNFADTHLEIDPSVFCRDATGQAMGGETHGGFSWFRRSHQNQRRKKEKKKGKRKEKLDFGFRNLSAVVF